LPRSCETNGKMLHRVSDVSVNPRLDQLQAGGHVIDLHGPVRSERPQGRLRTEAKCRPTRSQRLDNQVGIVPLCRLFSELTEMLDHARPSGKFLEFVRG